MDRDDVVDQALLAKGFYIVMGAVPYNFDGPVVAQWNLIYQHLTAHGFSTKPVLAGAGGAAGEAYAWAIENPEKVSCIYAENPSIIAIWRKFNHWKTSSLWRKPGYLFCTFAVAATPCSKRAPAWRKSDTRSQAEK